MIDEKKIGEAAINTSIEDTNKGRVREDYVISAMADHELGFQDGFKSGINWFKENLWHDGEEVPTEKNKNILRYFESYSVGERELDYDEYYELCNTKEDGFNENTWKIFCDIGGWCSRWLYIEDLMKGGK